MIKRTVTVLRWIAYGIIAYICLGALLHYVIFPEPTPDGSFVPRVGAKFANASQGTHLVVVKREAGLLWIDATFEGNAPGPIPHIHTAFEERFEVLQGTLSILVDGRKSILRPGETVVIPRGSVHQPFNETDAIVTVRGFVPENFGIYVSQVYGFFSVPENSRGIRPFLQLSLLVPRYETWGADMPIAVQKSMYFLLAPTARLLGYKTAYEKYIPQQ